MFGQQRTRTLLAPADPARNTAVAPPRLSAHELIIRAEASTEPSVGRRHTRPTRRLILATGMVAATVGVAAVVNALDTSAPDGSKTANQSDSALGPVLVPVAYQINSDPSPAAAKLRALADKLADTPYDNNHTGRYMYHHTKTWGNPVMTSADGRYHYAFADETEVWQATDGTGKQVTTQLEPQFPDQQSRDYWQRNLKIITAAPNIMSLPPEELAPLPSDRAQLSELLNVRFGAGSVSKAVGMVYGRYTVARQTRAEILRILADVSGFLWRGEVTDRVGRKGVAITFDDRDNDGQSLLIFDPNTGGLLAHERLTLSPTRISTYQLILDTDRTNQLG